MCPSSSLTWSPNKRPESCHTPKKLTYPGFLYPLYVSCPYIPGSLFHLPTLLGFSPSEPYLLTYDRITFPKLSLRSCTLAPSPVLQRLHPIRKANPPKYAFNIPWLCLLLSWAYGPPRFSPCQKPQEKLLPSLACPLSLAS